MPSRPGVDTRVPPSGAPPSLDMDTINSLIRGAGSAPSLDELAAYQQYRVHGLNMAPEFNMPMGMNQNLGGGVMGTTDPSTIPPWAQKFMPQPPSLDDLRRSLGLPLPSLPETIRTVPNRPRNWNEPVKTEA